MIPNLNAYAQEPDQDNQANLGTLRLLLSCVTMFKSHWFSITDSGGYPYPSSPFTIGYLDCGICFSRISVCGISFPGLTPVLPAGYLMLRAVTGFIIDGIFQHSSNFSFAIGTIELAPPPSAVHRTIPKNLGCSVKFCDYFEKINIYCPQFAD